MTWARVMRGTNSMAKAVAFAPFSASTVSFSRQASSMAMTMAPGLSALVSCAVGPRTFSTMSAPSSTARVSGFTVAPASA
ncbi:hypothetical protein D3C71_1163890 [compost metagenome]